MVKKCMALLKVKAWAWALALVGVVFVSGSAEAGFTTHKKIESSGRRKLESYTVYTVTDNFTVKGGSGLSAYYMDENSIAVLYIPSNKTLKVTGGKGSGTSGAGAGIEIPSSSTLIITGGGTIEATGGQAASGSAGGNGEDANVDGSGKPKDEWGRAGKGGSGGSGGGGAGAGIGGKGGIGGEGREEPRKASNWHDTNGDWECRGYNGYSGYSGGNGNSGGNVYIMGSVHVKATGGSAGEKGGGSGANGSKDKEYWTLSYRAGGGGGGGGGGAGYAASNFGGGGAGGGAGGGGGEGSRYRTTQGYTYRSANGGHGGGGTGSTSGSGSRTDGEDGWFVGTGGNGGGGGSSGGLGLAGKVYKDDGATVEGFSADYSITSHWAIEYTLTFDDDWRLTTNLTVRFGYALPKGPVTDRYGYKFKGWYTGTNGTGTYCYDENGNPKISVWTNPGNVTLYPKWELDEHEPISNVTLYVKTNDGSEVTVQEGTSVSGTGWNYDSSKGYIFITGADNTYTVRGTDIAGFAQIRIGANSTVQVLDTLTMEPGERANYSPIIVAGGVEAILDVGGGWKDTAECNLKGSDGHTAIRVPSGAALTVKTAGILNAMGGDDAADIGVNADEGNGGDVFVELYDDWAANIRPGHGDNASNGLLNAAGKGARFRSLATSNTVWCVRMTDLAVSEDVKKMWLQRVENEVWDNLRANASGWSWIWMPNGGYEWAEKLYASSKVDSLWVAYVEDAHTAAEFFTPLYVEINGEDIAHLTGPGWYSTRTSASEENSKATLVITNAGPHIVSGYGNAAIEVRCSMELTISNLVLNVSSWEGKTVLGMPEDDAITLDLTLAGTNRLTSAANRAGIFVGRNHTLNIDGDGSLQVIAGANSAGIGGGAQSSTAKQCGNINIHGGRITAIGGSNSAGIGGAQTKWDNSAIRIDGGVVTARGGQYGAGIGGGYTGKANVYITGGTVFPTAGSKAYAIGQGYNASGTSANEFGLAAIYTETGKVSPAAKNSSGNQVFPVSFDFGVANANITNIVIDTVPMTVKDIWSDESGRLTLWFEATGSIVTVTVTGVDDDGNETTKSWGYKLDGDGDYEFSNDILTVDGIPVVGGKSNSGPGWSYVGSTTNMKITSGNHTIGGNSTNGSIRVVVTGKDVGITLDSLTLMTPASDLSPFVISNKCTVTLVGESTIECIADPDAYNKGSMYTAAIEVPKGASLTIDGDGSLTATAGIYGAGIGSRGKTSKGGSLNAGRITIHGGSIYATGRGDSFVGGGAGVGGGSNGGVEAIIVTNGYLNAVGGAGACGVGPGSGRVTLTNGTFRVTGGTVLALKGAGDISSDFVTASGSMVGSQYDKSIVIDGGSVRPKSATDANSNAKPTPVNSSNKKLVFYIIAGLSEEDVVTVKDPLWAQYNNVDLLTDEDGCICLWGEKLEKNDSNAVRSVDIENPNIDGGVRTITISSTSNSVHTVSGGSSAESRIIDGKTCWRVEVHALPAGKRMNVTGIDSAYTRGTVLSDKTGKIYLYLPDGEYDFTIGGYTYHASVSGAPTVATYKVGILVDGTDIGEEEGVNWNYNGTEERLTLWDSVEYVIAGTNSERRVQVYADVPGVQVRGDRLVLKGTDDGPFALAEGATLEFTGGTISSGKIAKPVTISGGSLEMDLPYTYSPSGDNAYCVTVGGLARYSKVTIENLEGLDGYDIDGIYANEYGEIFLYLPDGDYFFRASDGDSVNEMIAIVDGEETTALNYTPTGVYINGREAARLRGDTWRNMDGLIMLNAATNYVITGTNDGAAVTFQAKKSGATLTLDNLVMTNELMLVSAIMFESESKSSYTLELVGTNVIYAAEEETCAVQLDEKAGVTVTGIGRLEVVGAEGGAAIGVEGGKTSPQSSLTVESGEIFATGGTNGAGIGGSDGTDGFKVSIFGGSVNAIGGTNGAAIGGGNGGAAGQVTVTNGLVYAESGTNGAAIGGGNGGASGNYVQSGGTVVTVGHGAADIGAGNGGATLSSGSTIVYGGSLKASSDNLTHPAKNSTGDKVYCVTLPTGRPNINLGALMGQYEGYSLTGTWTDDSGNVYIWLKNGKYYINIANIPFRAVVNGADTEAEQWAVGVTVNGEDAALRSGAGWKYDVDTSKLYVFDDGCVVSGSNTTEMAYLQFTNSVSVAVSNLVLTTASSSSVSPVSVRSGASVSMSLVGSNEFASASSGYAGVSVPYGATLSITNIDSIVSVPDLDNISVYTNILYDIEYDENGDPVLDGDGNIITNAIIYVEVAVTNYIDKLVAPILYSNGATYAAGIGGGNHESFGLIEINGGDIISKGDYAAGIGSGYFEDSGSNAGTATTLRQGEIRIKGGTVTATGGAKGAGLGGGNTHSGGVITISGGTVTAIGGLDGAGIGGGTRACGHTVSISGGEVTAQGGARASGIGGGNGNGSAANIEVCQIAISGGRVTANGGVYAAGIGSGRSDIVCAAVNITGGTVVATSGDGEYGYNAPYDIGIGSNNDSSKITHPLTIKGASVHATHRTGSADYVCPAPSNGVSRVYCVTVDTGSADKLVKVDYLSGFDESSEIYSDSEGKVYFWLPNGKYIFYVDNKPFTATVSNGDVTAGVWTTGVTADGVDVAFASEGGKSWAYDFEQKLLYINGNCTVSGTNTEDYVSIIAGASEDVEGSATATEVDFSFAISNLYLKTKSAAPISITNCTVTVCLAGTNTLDATGSADCAALSVEYGATLVLTNLEETAALEAYGGIGAAGIGGGYCSRVGMKRRVGTIDIRGGFIKAQGGIGNVYLSAGAGIGSGHGGTSGDINISGGNIQAYGGIYTLKTYASTYRFRGAGIGGGCSSHSQNCKIVISGGTIAAGGKGFADTDDHYAADIGNGYNGTDGYSVTIVGGSVKPLDSSERAFNQSMTDFSERIVPRNSGDSKVLKVTLDGFTPNGKTDFSMNGYGSNDIYADDDGKIYLWLASGTYKYSIGTTNYYLVVQSDGSYASEVMPDAYGIEVDGTDIVECTGNGWNYNPVTKALDISGNCTVSGTNTESAAKMTIADGLSVVVSNLCMNLWGAAPVNISGEVTMILAGTNTLTATSTGSGISVTTGNTLNISGDGALYATGASECAAIGSDNESNAGTVKILGGYVNVHGGNTAAGIGSGKGHDGGTVEISGGTVVARGSGTGPGIGAGRDGEGVRVKITGGIVDVTAGSDANGIGGAVTSGGKSSSRNSRVEISGGTVKVRRGEYSTTNAIGSQYADSDDIAFSGGSIDVFSSQIKTPVTNSLGQAVYKVTVSGLDPNAVVAISGLSGYGVDDVYANESGKIYLWLPNGTHEFGANGVQYNARVSGDDVTAYEDVETGVFAGSDQVGVAASGAGWYYDYANQYLVLTGDVVLSGTNTAGEVKISTAANVKISPSRLVLDAGSGANVISGAGSVAITNGTAMLTGNTSCPVNVLGGSLKFSGTAAVAFSNETAAVETASAVQLVTVPDLTPNAAVAFDGLPPYYGTSNIYADDEGKVYLWLPEAWDTSGVVPHLLLASSRIRLLGDAPGTSHTFAANGYNYTVTISATEGSSSAEKGAQLELTKLVIECFDVEDRMLRIGFIAKPNTWLYGFSDRIQVKASPSLPVEGNSEAMVLDMSKAKLTLEGSDSAVLEIPVEDDDLRFFIVEEANLP